MALAVCIDCLNHVDSIRACRCTHALKVCIECGTPDAYGLCDPCAVNQKKKCSVCEASVSHPTDTLCALCNIAGDELEARQKKADINALRCRKCGVMPGEKHWEYCLLAICESTHRPPYQKHRIRCEKVFGHKDEHQNGDDLWRGTENITDRIAAIRHDSGKARYDLLPAIPLAELVDVLTWGAKKYEDRNWEKGFLYSRCFASMMRHAWAFWRGEDKDPESGLSHMAHVACNAFFLIEYCVRETGKDDRVK